VKNFIIFQLTMLLIYALAVLALNILTGCSGQFSLARARFNAVGAYTSAILMEHAGIKLCPDIADRRHRLLRLWISVRTSRHWRLSGVYWRGDLRIATAMPHLLKLGYFEHWTAACRAWW